MTIRVETRLSDSPYVESIMSGRTERGGHTMRPAETRWHMVLTKPEGKPQFLLVGPLTTAGMLTYPEGVEILWIRFKLGTFIPHLPAKTLLNAETPLPAATRGSFWLKGAAWQFPTYENADTFVERLVRDEIVVHDPVISAALEDQPLAMSPRTVRHHFLRATGMTQTHIRQYERAQRAASRLEGGVPILDVVEDLGYFDQPHLTRALKRFIGKTPAQVGRSGA